MNAFSSPLSSNLFCLVWKGTLDTIASLVLPAIFARLLKGFFSTKEELKFFNLV